MNDINLKLFNSIEIDTGETVPFNMANWPIDENGNPVSKHGVLWDGSKVILKTRAQLDSDAASKALSETDAKMPRVLEDIIDVLITKNTFRKNEMPIAVQELYNLKKELRSKVIK